LRARNWPGVFIVSLAAGCGGAEFSAGGPEGGSGGDGTSGSGANGSGGNGATPGGGGASAGMGGRGGGTSPGGAGGVAGGNGGGAGGEGRYPEAVCDVPTHQGAPADAPSCSDSVSGCLIDWAGAFGVPGVQDGPQDQARFVGLYGLAGDGTYVYASTAHSIRRIAIATGEVDTLSGTGAPGYFDGDAQEARFACPRGLAVREGYVYVADAGNDRVRRVDAATGAVTTVGAGHTFSGPAHLYAREETLFIVEPPEHRMSGLHLTSEIITRFAVNGGLDSAGLSSPHGLVFVDEWNLFYIADSGNHVVRKITEMAADPPQLGVIGQAGRVDGNGTETRFDTPLGMSVRQSPMTLYVADHGNHAVRRIQPMNGYAVTTMAGDGVAGHAVGAGSAARLTEPTDVHYDPGTNSLFVAEGTVIRRMSEPVH
jgi:hypothetical protein